MTSSSKALPSDSPMSGGQELESHSSNSPSWPGQHRRGLTFKASLARLVSWSLLVAGTLAVIATAGVLLYWAARGGNAPLANVQLINLYQENGTVYFRVSGLKRTNDQLSGVYLSWRFSDLTLIPGEPLLTEDDEVASPGFRVANEEFVSQQLRAAINMPSSSRITERLAADPGAMMRLCFVYPQAQVELQCFETPANQISEGPVVPSLPVVVIPESLH